MFPYTITSLAAILLSCLLGTVVSLSAFLTIGASSSLSYTVIGHIKTVSNLFGGYLIFGDTFRPAQLAGIVLALAGIAWFSQVGVRSGAPPAALAHGTIHI